MADSVQCFEAWVPGVCAIGDDEFLMFLRRINQRDASKTPGEVSREMQRNIYLLDLDDGAVPEPRRDPRRSGRGGLCNGRFRSDRRWPVA